MQCITKFSETTTAYDVWAAKSTDKLLQNLPDVEVSDVEAEAGVPEGHLGDPDGAVLAGLGEPDAAQPRLDARQAVRVQRLLLLRQPLQPLGVRRQRRRPRHDRRPSAAAPARAVPVPPLRGALGEQRARRRRRGGWGRPGHGASSTEQSTWSLRATASLDRSLVSLPFFPFASFLLFSHFACIILGRNFTWVVPVIVGPMEEKAGKVFSTPFSYFLACHIVPK